MTILSAHRPASGVVAITMASSIERLKVGVMSNVRGKARRARVPARGACVMAAARASEPGAQADAQFGLAREAVGRRELVAVLELEVVGRHVDLGDLVEVVEGGGI